MEPTRQLSVCYRSNDLTDYMAGRIDEKSIRFAIESVESGRDLKIVVGTDGVGNSRPLDEWYGARWSIGHVYADELNGRMFGLFCLRGSGEERGLHLAGNAPRGKKIKHNGPTAVNTKLVKVDRRRSG
jgi:hypothetical protein